MATSNIETVRKVYPKCCMRHMNGWYWVTMYYQGPALCAAQRTEQAAFEAAAEYVRSMIV